MAVAQPSLSNLDAGRLLAVARAGLALAATIVLALVAARLSWILLAGAGHDVATPMVVSGPVARTAAGGVDVAILERVTPFRAGPATADPQAEAEALAAPETELDLRLFGVRAGSDETGVAYIAAEGQAQAGYRVGDEIDGAEGVTLERIFTDSVLLRRNGRLERLMRGGERDGAGIVTLGGARQPAPETPQVLSGPDAPGQAAATASGDGPQPASAAPDAREEDEARRRLAFLQRAELLDLAQSIRLDPKTGGVEGGGFSVFPTRNAGLLAKAGLRPGDVVQRIGGIELTEAADLGRVLSELDGERRVEIRLVRGGERQVLTLELED